MTEAQFIDYIEGKGWELYTRVDCRYQPNENTSWFCTREGEKNIFLSTVPSTCEPNLSYMLGKFLGILTKRRLGTEQVIKPKEY